MPISNLLKLNFLPVEDGLSEFVVYRKLRLPQDHRANDVFGFSLPEDRQSDIRRDFWVSLSPLDGFESFTASAFDNAHLTRRVLFSGLCESARQYLEDHQFELPSRSYFEEIAFNFDRHPEGVEQLHVQPYLLRQSKKFGWLLDYHFRKDDGIDFSRRVQQLSLSLDANYKRNLDCYLDRYNKIQSFLNKRRDVFDRVQLPSASIAITTSEVFLDCPSRRLLTKNYIFGGMRENRSQFGGLQQFGPLARVPAIPRLLFAFRERDRPAARRLAIALQGSKNQERFSFPGFEGLFKTQIEIDKNPIVLDDLSHASFTTALERVKQDRAANPTVVPIFVLPDGDDNGYMNQKAIFASEGIPTQTCTLKVINDEYTLKWSIANIALQIFCKAGGQPWKVRPTKQRSLIIGISQSHKLYRTEKGTQVEKYFAFSVMTDNSGLFQRLQVLGENGSKEAYLQSLESNLKKTLEDESQEFSQVVIHTSFKLKHEEMKVIERSVQLASKGSSASGCRFAVVKVNHKNRFFAFNTDVNSLVPFEGSIVKLGGGEYLIWFEGILADKPTVNKAFTGPTHVSFLYRSSHDSIADDALLQDLVNLSGANWRGFNAKSAPVSVFYCQLVADLVQDFQNNELPLPKVQDLRPWFL